MCKTVHSPSVISVPERCIHFLGDISKTKTRTDGCWYFGWIILDYEELIYKVYDKYNQDVSQQEIRDTFIELVIHEINHSVYGASGVYELYEERKLNAIEDILECFSFTDEEVALIKKQCDYVEDRQAFVLSCECGAVVNALQFAQSVSIMGSECCVNCMVY